MAETLTSKKKAKQTETEMSFWGHLEALRGHLFRSAAVIITFAIVAFLNKEIIFDKIILAPKDSDFISNQLLCKLGEWLKITGLCLGDYNIELINLNLSGQFSTHMSISFFAGLILAFPYVIWEIWRFLKPALYENERKHSRGAVFIMTILFLTGISFSYFVLVPLTLNFLGTYQVSNLVANQISLSSYISTLVSVTFSVGLVFEFPVFVYFLARVGIISVDFLRRTRKYMIVVILIIAAIITPPDIFSQILVSIPLLGLYEISILVAARIKRNQPVA